ELNDGKYEYGTVDFIDLDNINMDEFAYGEVQAQCGKAAFEYIKTAVDYAQNGAAKAIATTPINKESLKAAEVTQTGQTEKKKKIRRLCKKRRCKSNRYNTN